MRFPDLNPNGVLSDVLVALLMAVVIINMAGVRAQTPPKPTLGTVDDALKKADTDRQATATEQAAAAKKLLDGQNAAARAAGASEERRREQLKSDENSRDARLKQVEDTLAQVEKDKADALAADVAQQKAIADRVEKSHDELMSHLQTALIGGAVTVLTGLIMFGINQWKLGAIHKLVNSGYTAEMQRGLGYLRITFATLTQLNKMTISEGETPTKESRKIIEACSEQIKELETQIDERLKAT